MVPLEPKNKLCQKFKISLSILQLKDFVLKWIDISRLWSMIKFISLSRQIHPILSSYENVFTSGIVLHKASKILLAEKFVDVQCYLPFPYSRLR